MARMGNLFRHPKSLFEWLKLMKFSFESFSNRIIVDCKDVISLAWKKIYFRRTYFTMQFSIYFLLFLGKPRVSTTILLRLFYKLFPTVSQWCGTQILLEMLWRQIMCRNGWDDQTTTMLSLLLKLIVVVMVVILDKVAMVCWFFVDEQLSTLTSCS